jgi:hypothetical protein
MSDVISYSSRYDDLLEEHNFDDDPFLNADTNDIDRENIRCSVVAYKLHERKELRQFVHPCKVTALKLL